MKCPKCKADLQNKAKYCPKCGNKIKNRFLPIVIVLVVLLLITAAAGITFARHGKQSKSGRVYSKEKTTDILETMQSEASEMITQPPYSDIKDDTTGASNGSMNDSSISTDAQVNYNETQNHHEFVSCDMTTDERDSLNKFIDKIFDAYYDATAVNAIYQAEYIALESHSSLYGYLYGIDVHSGDGLSTDPLNNFSYDTYYSYGVLDGEKADWLITNILNVKPIHHETPVSETPGRGRLYYRDGKYYIPYGDVGGFSPILNISSITTDGTYYYVEYNYGWEDDSESDFTCAYALLQPKEIDGETWWSLYYVSNNPIDNLDHYINTRISNIDKHGDKENWSIDEVRSDVFNEYKYIVTAFKNENDGSFGYAVYDIDKDGIEELILTDWYYYTIYSFDGLSAYYMGDYDWTYNECLYEYDGNGIIVHEGGEGMYHIEFISLYTFDSTDGLTFAKYIFDGSIDKGEITDELNKYRRIEFCKSGDLSLLNI